MPRSVNTRSNSAPPASGLPLNYARHVTCGSVVVLVTRQLGDGSIGMVPICRTCKNAGYIVPPDELDVAGPWCAAL
jgi:hypothetical protein